MKTNHIAIRLNDEMTVTIKYHSALTAYHYVRLPSAWGQYNATGCDNAIERGGLPEPYTPGSHYSQSLERRFDLIIRMP